MMSFDTMISWAYDQRTAILDVLAIDQWASALSALLAAAVQIVPHRWALWLDSMFWLFVLVRELAGYLAVGH